MIFFISDTHYSHRNIVRGVSQWTDKSGCRDFGTLEQHDQFVVDLINNRVGRRDILYHLGDWSFGGKPRVREFREKLNCERVHLIIGNHDHHAAVEPNVFDTVEYYRELQIGSTQLVLCHYPIESWNNMERGSYHLHGHVHGQGVQKYGRLDVGVEAKGLLSLDDVASTPKATESRHSTIHGGNKFA